MFQSKNYVNNLIAKGERERERVETHMEFIRKGKINEF